MTDCRCKFKVTGPANVAGVQVKFGATRDTSDCPEHRIDRCPDCGERHPIEHGHFTAKHAPGQA